jgi:protein MpaA
MHSSSKIELIGSGDVLVIGVFHGDEPQGKFIIENYINERLTLHDSRFTFIPCLNPDGLALGTRENANGVDLNRNFPTKNWEAGTGGESPASEIETQFLIDVIEKHKPRLILTLHAPFKVVNYDGPARDTAEKISKIFNYPVQENIGYPTPGSFGTWAGVERNIPVITLELDEQCPVTDLVEPFCEVLLKL